MVNKYVDQSSNSLSTREVKYVAEPLEYIFDYLTASNFYSSVIFNADETAYAQSDSHGSGDYYRLMWFRTKHVPSFNYQGCGVLASLIYSAWVDAGNVFLNLLTTVLKFSMKIFMD
jgi:hypothetical protein